MIRKVDEEIISKFLKMLVDYDKDDWKSVKVNRPSIETKRLYTVGVEPFLEVDLDATEFYIKYTNIKLVIKTTSKGPNKGYWKHFIKDTDIEGDKNKDKDILWSVELYPDLVDDWKFSYQEEIYYSSISGWNFISKDIEDMVCKILDNCRKYNKWARMEKVINDVVDDFYKRKLAKNIKKDLSISKK